MGNLGETNAITGLKKKKAQEGGGQVFSCGCGGGGITNGLMDNIHIEI